MVIRLTPSPAFPAGETDCLSDATSLNFISAAFSQVARLRRTAPKTSLSSLIYADCFASEDERAMLIVPVFHLRREPLASSGSGGVNARADNENIISPSINTEINFAVISFTNR